MGLDVPVGKGIPRVVTLVASHLDLLETPLWQVDIAGAEVTAKNLMFQPEGSSQGADLAPVARCNILDHFDLPMILIVPNSEVAVRGHFLVALGDRSWDIVGVQVSACLRVDQTNDGAVSNKSWLSLWIIVGIAAVGVEPPLVVGIFVVVACNLLLVGSLGIS